MRLETKHINRTRAAAGIGSACGPGESPKHLEPCLAFPHTRPALVERLSVGRAVALFACCSLGWRFREHPPPYGGAGLAAMPTPCQPHANPMRPRANPMRPHANRPMRHHAARPCQPDACHATPFVGGFRRDTSWLAPPPPLGGITSWVYVLCNALIRSSLRCLLCGELPAGRLSRGRSSLV
jgi:hypothetical protein